MRSIEQYIGPLVGALVVAMLAVTVSVVSGESKPVLSYIMTTGSWEFSGNRARNEFAGLKIRACKVIEDSLSGVAIIGGELVKQGVSVRYQENLTAEDERGAIHVGSIEWEVAEMDRANKIGMIVAHECPDQVIWSEYWYELPLLDMREGY